MKRLKFICLAVIQLARQVCLLPQSFAIAVKRKQQWAVRNKLEAERLDRIRNPDKYLGK
jgi:hypothetical protein